MLTSPLDSLRTFGHWACLRATLPISMLRGQCGSDGFGILMYHRICAHVPGVSPPTWNVTPKSMETQLCYLLNRGYEPWALKNLIARVRTGDSIPRRAFAVTFDDAYRCVATSALPILEKLKIPATVFVATGLLGQPGRMHQDDWAAAGLSSVPNECYEAMSLKDCDDINQSILFDLGSHTHTHQDFRNRCHDFKIDIQSSMAFMESRWGLRDIPFAFPYGCSERGYCTAKMKEIVRDIGFSCALTADDKIVDPMLDDIYSWGRVTVTESDSGRVLAAKLDDWYGAVKRFKQRLLYSKSI